MPECPRRSRIGGGAPSALVRRDVLACAVLYLVVAATYLTIVGAVNRPQVLTGEEASVSFVDVVAVGQRFQFTHFSTNFGGHVVFWLASHLAPSVDLFYGRRAKALVMALVAPLVFWTLHRRLGCGRGAAALGAVAAALMPGVLAYCWLATENGFEAVTGLIAMLWATSARRGWWAAPLMAAVSVSTYGAGLAWAVGVGAVIGVRLVAMGRRRWLPAAGALAAATAGLGVVLFPLYWWQGGVVVTGGGRADLTPSWSTFRDLLSELTLRGGGSYYYFDRYPALSSIPLALVACAGIAWAAWRRAGWPWVVVLISSISLYALSAAQFAGVRRTIAVPVIAAIGLGVVADVLARAIPRLHAIRARRPIAAAPVLAVSACLVVVPLVVQAQSTARELMTGRLPLPVEFRFHLDRAVGMPRELERVAEALRAGRTWKDLIVDYEPTRTAAMIYLLSGSGDLPTAPITGAEVRKLYEQSEQCETNCRTDRGHGGVAQHGGPPPAGP